MNSKIFRETVFQISIQNILFLNILCQWNSLHWLQQVRISPYIFLYWWTAFLQAVVDPEVQGLKVIIDCPQPGSSRATYRPLPISRWSKCGSNDTVMDLLGSGTSKVPEETQPQWLDPTRHWWTNRRCRWPSMLVTGLRSSVRYPGAMLCWHLYDLDAQPELDSVGNIEPV